MYLDEFLKPKQPREITHIIENYINNIKIISVNNIIIEDEKLKDINFNNLGLGKNMKFISLFTYPGMSDIFKIVYGNFLFDKVIYTSNKNINLYINTLHKYIAFNKDSIDTFIFNYDFFTTFLNTYFIRK